VASGIRVEAILSAMAIGLSLAHNVDTPDALLIATRFFEVIFLTRLRLEKPTPSDGLHEVSMHAVHGLMESDWRRVNATESARISGLWITKRVDPGHRRQPAWSSECHVDVLVVQIMYAFAAEVSMHAVVPRCIPWTGTDTSDKLLYFILESLYLPLAFGLRLLAGFTTGIGTLVSFSACGSGSHHA